ncbi:hypothetical protein [Maricaulis virginensis]|uniref:Uncharacterized protein n=1 Tax=Maricaulis virginensis TaxID=144022 RepID=A0A9W6IQ88_9PROT|nr:hypothetical protein [Maricaulis virginensis]GLK53614.1 hypothetical protein GCM10017621_31220 [Maricaulis virginensis]
MPIAITPAGFQALESAKQRLQTDRRVALDFKGARPDLESVSVEDATIMVSCTLNVVLKWMLEQSDIDTACSKCRIIIETEKGPISPSSQERVSSDRPRNRVKLKKDLKIKIRSAIERFNKDHGARISGRDAGMIAKMISESLSKLYLNKNIQNDNILSVKCTPA